MKSVKILCQKNKTQSSICHQSNSDTSPAADYSVRVSSQLLYRKIKRVPARCVSVTDFHVVQFLSLEVCDAVLKLSDAALGVVGRLLNIHFCLSVNTVNEALPHRLYEQLEVLVKSHSDNDEITGVT